MTRNILAIVAAAVFAVGMATAPASAGLLGKLGKTVEKTVDKVVDTVDKTVDKVTETVDDVAGTNTKEVVDDVVTINDQDADGLVNVTTQGDNLVTATVGPDGQPLVRAGVGLLNERNLLSLDLDALGLDVDLVIGISDPTNPNGPQNPNNPNNPVLVGSLGGGATFMVTCAVNNAKTLLQVAANGKLTASEIKAWQRAANVQIIPVELCPEAKAQIAKLFARSKKILLLQRAVTTDNLIMASLSRTRYDANDVAAVQRRGGQLVVYVY